MVLQKRDNYLCLIVFGSVGNANKHIIHFPFNLWKVREIKNIGIIHNREFEEGVLKIEFYDGISMEKGAALLKKRNYIVYER